MKSIITIVVLTICVFTVSMAQPNGGSNGNNGNGNGGCANPPCGGPNSVPIDTEWLFVAGLIAGCYIKFLRRVKTNV